ncbi:hypothetical protein [Alkalilacustris brevis]|uniref:hypothetical protein n=1 Tax=Alkalilacustris brevis TaxID=2026338 RepID=UPI000E0D9256|nr:hypothetical protein [Alkalilacustris brevis]
MTAHISGTPAPIDPQRAWPAARIAEARAVLADVAHHSDHLVRLACNVLTAHGETEAERRDARALLFVIEARCPARHRRAQSADHDDGPEVRR